MKKDELKQIMSALESGKFKVTVEAPVGISEHTNFEGVRFLRLCGDGSASGIHAGSCTVHVDNHTFVCDLNSGEWSENDEVLTLVSLIKALERAEGVYSGAHSDAFSLCELYARLNKLPSEISYCWTDGNNLKAVDELGEGEVDITVRYTVKDEGGWDVMDASVDDGLLFYLYRLLKQQQCLPEGEDEVEVEDVEVRKQVPELYEDILAQIKDENSEDEEYFFSIPLTRSVFEETLYGEV